MAKKVTRRRKFKAWTSQDHRDLKAHSKAKSPVKKISKVMKRTMGAIRQKALNLGMPIGHRRWLDQIKPLIGTGVKWFGRDWPGAVKITKP